MNKNGIIKALFLQEVKNHHTDSRKYYIIELYAQVKKIVYTVRGPFKCKKILKKICTFRAQWGLSAL